MTDEWGGGTGPMCQAGSIMELGGNTIITLERGQQEADAARLLQASRRAVRARRTASRTTAASSRCRGATSTCRAGIRAASTSWTSPTRTIRPRSRTSIAVRSIRRRPPDVPADADAGGGRVAGRGTIGGSWGAYYWNGLIYSSELDRGFDIFELTPSDAALGERDRRGEAGDAEGVQPAEPAEARLAGGVPGRALVPRPARAQRRPRGRSHHGDRRARSTRRRSRAAPRVAAALTALAKQVDGYASGAKDAARVRTMSAAIKQLAAASK